MGGGKGNEKEDGEWGKKEGESGRGEEREGTGRGNVKEDREKGKRRGGRGKWDGGRVKRMETREGKCKKMKYRRGRERGKGRRKEEENVERKGVGN